METISIGSDLDRISDLPINVIDHILAFLPFKDAVRTSTLSKNWKEKWHTLPHIILDEEMYKPHWRKLDGMVSYILAVHEGRIEKFSVSVEVEDSYTVKSWISRLEEKGIQELFILYLRYGYRKEVPNEVPSILFSCQQLRKLSLGDCVLKPARSYRGFPSLISLELNKVIIETDVFEKLISSCPLLEQLTLKKSHFADRLEINVPKLKHLCFDGELASLCLNTPFLEMFSINAYRNRLDDGYYYDRDPSSFRFKICGLPCTIKELYVQCKFQKYLAACDTDSHLKMPGLNKFCDIFTYSHLTTLGLGKFCFEKVEQVVCLFSIIGGCDNLTTLDITACYCRNEAVTEPLRKFWEEQNDVPLMLNKLRKVRVGSFHGKGSEMMLIKYVMTNSPALEEMTVECIEKHILNEDELKGVLQDLCKTSTQLSFIAVNLESEKDDFSYSNYRPSRDSYVEDSD